MLHIQGKRRLRRLAVWAALALVLVFAGGTLADNGGAKTTPDGQGEEAKPKAKVITPEKGEDLEKDTKFKTRKLQPRPAPARKAEEAPAKPGGTRFGGQPIRSKESEAGE